MRELFIAVLATTLLVITGVPAGAGGWWSTPHVQGREFGTGETVVATSEAFFSTGADAERALATDHFAYLVGDYDRRMLARAQGIAEPRRWWSVAAGAAVHKVGRVRLHDMDANVGRAVSRMTIPHIRPGRYVVMFCDEGCRSPLAHVVPTAAIWITDDAVAARAARRADAVARRTLSQLSTLRHELRDARQDAVQAMAAADTATRDAQVAQALARAAPPTSWPAPAAAFAGGLVMAALLAAPVLLLARRRMRRQEQSRWRPPPATGRDHADEFEMARN